MFFTNIETYSKKKLLLLSIAFHVIYFLTILVCPIITISFQYKIFENVPAHLKLTGIGLILFVSLGMYCYIKLKEMVGKLPQITLGQQRLKFTLQTIFSCLPLSIILLALAMTKSSIDVAFKTFQYCALFILGANFIDGFFLKYISAENDLRIRAQELLEIDSRKELLSKKGKENEKKN